MNDPFVPLIENDPRLGRLLTASATTGWLDWIHGELWLFSDGLLRIPLNLGITIAHGFWPTVNLESPRQQYFDQATLNGLKQRGVWVSREAIERAFLHHGAVTDRLRLVLKGGDVVTFLWLPWDEAWDVLCLKLLAWLGTNFLID